MGSFQIDQSRTHAYRAAAAAAKRPKSAALRGGTFAGRPPFAHAGVPVSVTSGRIPRARSAPRTASDAPQS